MDYILEKYFYETDILKFEKFEYRYRRSRRKTTKFRFLKKVYMVGNRKQYSVRGDILDIFNENDENP